MLSPLSSSPPKCRHNFLSFSMQSLIWTARLLQLLALANWMAASGLSQTSGWGTASRSEAPGSSCWGSIDCLRKTCLEKMTHDLLRCG